MNSFNSILQHKIGFLKEIISNNLQLSKIVSKRIRQEWVFHHWHALITGINGNCFSLPSFLVPQTLFAFFKKQQRGCERVGIIQVSRTLLSKLPVTVAVFIWHWQPGWPGYRDSQVSEMHFCVFIWQPVWPAHWDEFIRKFSLFWVLSNEYFSFFGWLSQFTRLSVL